MDRVIGLIDMDCFYAQVEQRERPELWNRPVVVVQHAREGAPGGILAVSYEARSFGVKRGMMISEAKAKCPELSVCFVPQGEHIDKADIQKYRDASTEVFDVLNSVDKRIIVERASVDEAYLDLTELVDQKIVEFGAGSLLKDLLSGISCALPTTHLADGNDKDDGKEYDRENKLRIWLDDWCAKEISHLRLAIAAQTVEQIRAKIRECTQFFCSGGIGNNKMLAKLVCSRHKPRQQTVLPFDFVPVVFIETPIGDVRMLGGKLGHAIQDSFGIRTMADLACVPFEMIERYFEGQAKWIHQLAKGIDDESVRWIEGLSKELSKRLVADQVKNKRTAGSVVFGVLGETQTTKTLKIASYRPQVLAEIIWGAARTYNKAPAGSTQWIPPILNLSISASRFTEGINAKSQSIMGWVEKRLKLSESGSSIFNPSSSPLQTPRIFVKGVLKGPAETAECSSGNASSASNSPVKVSAAARNSPHVELNVDDDGWQIYDPAQFGTDEISAGVSAAEFCNFDVISSLEFQELPANVREELAHFHKLEQAKKLKEATSERDQRQLPGQKRQAKIIVKTSPVKKKKIDAFFKKD